MKQYVIIGGGVAAVGCIEGIRRVDAGGRIALICGEKRPVYCRPLISYYLQGKTDFEKMKYRPDSFYADNRCDLIDGTAAGIDSAGKTVTLDDGRCLPYDSLCVAAGSVPFVPAFAGLDTVKNVFGFMTEADAAALDGAIGAASRVLVIGAGMIGLKCAEGLCGRVASVTVCDLAPCLLSRILDRSCAAILQKKMEENGIRFLLGEGAERFEGNTAVLKGGERISFDILVLAVGVRPNISVFKAAGGLCRKGICADKHLRTSLKDVYAAGDCAEGYDASTGENRVLATFPNAYLQGSCAGANMAGGAEVFDTGIPMNAISFFGLHALTAGNCTGKMLETKTDAGVKRLFVQDGRLTGFLLIGDAAGAGIYTAMIREKTPLACVDFKLLQSSPSVAAFTAEHRRKMLGEVV